MTSTTSQPAPSRVLTIISMIVTAVIASVAILGAWLIFDSANLPAFNTSMVVRALSTATIVPLLLLVAILCWRWSTKNPGKIERWFSLIVTYLAPAGLVFCALGIPLAGTTLYLDGIQADQGFRTQFLTRTATTLANADMNYWDMPSYYPLGWFWLGGRLANLMGLAGWEVYQPWALVSMGAAASVLVPVWRHITNSLPMATLINLVSTIIVVGTVGEEPYGAIVAMYCPVVIVLAYRALTSSWWAAGAIAIILGASATFYTLYTGVTALSFVLISFYIAIRQRAIMPVIRMIVVGLCSGLIALITWGPYLLQVLRGAPTESAAMHYLPEAGTLLPLPFTEFSVAGVLCLIGVIFLILRFRDTQVQVMIISLAGLYLWSLASMLITLKGTTLLGFRIEVLVVLQLSIAGLMGLAYARQHGLSKIYPESFGPRKRRQASAIAAVLLLALGIASAQQIPRGFEEQIDLAHTDTDGNGVRPDGFAPNTAQYFGAIDEEIRSNGYVPEDTVVLADESRFLDYFPYYGFNAETAHYANPLGQFSERNDLIRYWADASFEELSDPDDFVAALEDAPWRGPDVILFQGSLDNATDPEAAWKMHIAEDIYPNQPNVRFVGLQYNPAVFLDETLWDLEQIGPYVVASRIRDPE